MNNYLNSKYSNNIISELKLTDRKKSQLYGYVLALEERLINLGTEVLYKVLSEIFKKK